VLGQSQPLHDVGEPNVHAFSVTRPLVMGASKPRAERSVALGSWHAKKFVKHKKNLEKFIF
jgi:hypothetical protein